MKNIIGTGVFALARLVFGKPKNRYDVMPKDGEASVYIANHSGIIGPVYMALYFKKPKKIWINHYALDKKQSPNYAFHDFFFGRSKKCKPFWRVLARVVAFFVRQALKVADGISVYHDKRIKDTFLQSVEALEGGKNVVIFPESPRKYSDYINTLYSGFCDLGRQYYEKTGKKLKFYPVYLSKKLRTAYYGAPVEYNPENADPKAENVRISEELRNRIDRLAKILPRHKPVPFLPQAWYDGYGEYIDHMSEYWKLFDSGKPTA